MSYWCLTMNNILVECIEYDIFNVTLKDIFDHVSSNKMISFIKRAGLYNTL